MPVTAMRLELAAICRVVICLLSRWRPGLALTRGDGSGCRRNQRDSRYRPAVSGFQFISRILSIR